MSAISSFTRWLQLKQYQLEVSFSVYIFTPIEKFVFYSVLFLLSSLTFIAVVLYLPQHIAFLINRAWFYAHGEPVDVVGIAKEAAQTFAHGALNAGTATVRDVGETGAAIVKEL